MKFLKISSVALLTFLGVTAFAQKNMVPNGGFDQTVKKPKRGVGELILAEPWLAPSEENVPDLLSAKIKKDYGVPDNKFGNQAAESGDNYAGLVMYSYRDAKPRTYIQTKLTGKLVAGKAYCVSFKVALSKTSKYAVNNIGMYLSVKKPREKEILSYTLKPQIMNSKNKIFDDQYLFETVCGVFKAKGDERYITIGNFAPQTNMVLKKDVMKMKRPKGMSQMQTQDAYYFVEDVSVINMQELESCSCEKEVGNEMQVVYSENVSDDMDMSVANQLKLKKVFFNSNSSQITSPGGIIDVIRTMKDDASLKVQVVGHSDKKEAENTSTDISAERAKTVMEYLISKGIPAGNLSSKGVQNSKPVDESGTQEGNAKNRRVEFKVM